MDVPDLTFAFNTYIPINETLAEKKARFEEDDMKLNMEDFINKLQKYGYSKDFAEKAA
jgi:hypothetical protein